MVLAEFSRSPKAYIDILASDPLLRSYATYTDNYSRTLPKVYCEWQDVLPILKAFECGVIVRGTGRAMHWEDCKARHVIADRGLFDHIEQLMQTLPRRHGIRVKRKELIIG